ncbi:hypothetical protein [Neptunomonas antarctica]|uniref:MSHA biogenesis protein MshK n=1 Tax=Neptunomonas antarctica TaxID=619304 RepID=A0A1N7MN37_9GAMM|nr:hypothetical protein [Neptunomonas antarctica]SIS87553.1 hypothetical protein SAMN05421760_106213 [Neptunomonas antarctica]
MAKFLVMLLMCYSVNGVAESQLKDPTQPYRAKTSVSNVVDIHTDYQVSAILKRKQAAWAIVNGIKAGVGDQVDGAKILRIAYDRVLLDVGDTQRWVSLSNYYGLKKSQ